MKYAEKLRDPRWQKRRLEIMERDEWRCLQCGSETATLTVHHDWYSGAPWEAPDAALRTLCEDCHRAWHRRAEIYGRQVAWYVDRCLKAELLAHAYRVMVIAHKKRWPKALVWNDRKD